MQDKESHKLAQKFFIKNKYAAKITMLEMKVEIEQIDMKDVYNLIALYSEAIDHFTSNGDESFIFFKLKLHRLLVNPRVSKMINELEALKQKLGLKTSKKLLNQVVSPKPNIEMKSKKQNFKNHTNVALKRKKSNEMKKMMTRHASISSVNDQKVKDDLDKQKENFKERLAQRRENSRSRRSRSFKKELKRKGSNASLGLSKLKDEQVSTAQNILDEYGGVFDDKV